MQSKYRIIIVLVASMFIASSAFAYSDGPPSGHAGDPPNRNNCTSCHFGFGVNAGQGNVRILDLPERYEPGETYRLTARLEDPNARRWGFQMTTLDNDNRPHGTLRTVNNQQTQIAQFGNSPQYLMHRSAGTFQNQQNGAQWAFDWTAPDEDIGPVNFYIMGNAANNSGNEVGDRIYGSSSSVEPIEVEEEPEIRDLVVTFERGWSVVSLNVSPSMDFYSQNENRGPDVILMTDQLRNGDEHRVEIFKDEFGRFYITEFDFNNIPYWDLTRGYMIKLKENVEATWSGEPIPFDTPIAITEGWNIVAYFPDYQLSASWPNNTVLADYLDNIEIAKDAFGRFLLPDFGFSNMQAWREGEGYFIKSFRDFELIYPENNQLANSAPALNKRGIEAPRSPYNLSLLVRFPDNSYDGMNLKAVASDGSVVGSSKIQGHQAGVAVWGDVENTLIKEGLQKDESFELFIVDRNNANLRSIETVKWLKGTELRYETDGFFAIEASAENSLPTAMSLVSLHPNPFNAMTTLSFDLHSSSEIAVQILDASGRFVSEISNGFLTAGSHSVNINAEQMSAGVYYVRLITQSQTLEQKIVLLK